MDWRFQTEQIGFVASVAAARPANLLQCRGRSPIRIGSLDPLVALCQVVVLVFDFQAVLLAAGNTQVE